MIPVLIIILIAIVVPLAVLMASIIISARSTADREKSSPFECGFDPNSNARLPFSLRFFLLAVIFLVFDIEIALLIPTPITLNHSITLETLIGVTLFVIILILGLLHEWNESSLDWSP